MKANRLGKRQPVLLFHTISRNLRSVLWILVLFLGVLLLGTTCSKTRPQEVPGKGYEVHFKKEARLAFIKKNTNDTLITINIEIADSEEERNQGLMWRYSMPDTNGMLFVFEQETPMSFWMKNTYIPLDIIFVSNTLEIVSIQNNTAPLSTLAVPSNKPARYVVEVNAWFCVEHGINVGDMIIFNKTG